MRLTAKLGWMVQLAAAADGPGTICIPQSRPASDDPSATPAGTPTPATG